MTRKKFVGALLDAIATFAALGKDAPYKSAMKFAEAIAGIFFVVDEDGTNEVEHYLLVELKDGSRWRIVPERVLQMEEHEELLWGEFRKAAESIGQETSEDITIDELSEDTESPFKNEDYEDKDDEEPTE